MLNLNLERAANDLYGLLENTKDIDTLRWMLKSEKNMLKADLYVAERMARIGGKRKTRDAHAVELYLDENIDRLTEALHNLSYSPSRGEAHIIYNPVIREIFAAPYIDRIVHHLVVDTINPWWDTRLWHGSSSCRVGKGTSYAIALLDKHIRRVSHNFARRTYVVKLDISGYFMHINRAKLLERVLGGLDKQFAGNYGKRYEIIKHAITAIIMDDPIKGVRIRGSYEDWRKLPMDKSLFAAPEGCGLVIGNVTSQVFSNIYLDPLDRFVTQELGYKNYGRYVDDFYIVVTEEEMPQVKRDIKEINRFLGLIGLSLNTKKTRIIEPWQGVPFLGMVNRNGVIMPDKRLTRNYRAAVREYVAGAKNRDSIMSYLGMMVHYDSYKMARKAFGRYGAMFDRLVEEVEFYEK